MQDLPEYSVLMSVYENDHSDWLGSAVGSMLGQTHAPKEIVIVEDGTLPKPLRDALDRLERDHPEIIRRIPLPQRGGLGNAMRIGVTECVCEWIARMDADDISEPRRCEAELRAAIRENADIVGCDCAEFMDSVLQTAQLRVFPERHAELVAFSKRRTPFCHPGVMMQKRAILRAGNYADASSLEDYNLFVRMLMTGSIGYTVKEPLIHMRVSRDFYRRRGGFAYAVRMLAFNRKLLKCGWIGKRDFFIRSGGNAVLALMPIPVRQWMYKRFLRK